MAFLEKLKRSHNAYRSLTSDDGMVQDPVDTIIDKRISEVSKKYDSEPRSDIIESTIRWVRFLKTYAKNSYKTYAEVAKEAGINSKMAENYTQRYVTTVLALKDDNYIRPDGKNLAVETILNTLNKEIVAYVKPHELLNVSDINSLNSVVERYESRFTLDGGFDNPYQNATLNTSSYSNINNNPDNQASNYNMSNNNYYEQPQYQQEQYRDQNQPPWQQRKYIRGYTAENEDLDPESPEGLLRRLMYNHQNIFKYDMIEKAVSTFRETPEFFIREPSNLESLLINCARTPSNTKQTQFFTKMYINMLNEKVSTLPIDDYERSTLSFSNGRYGNNPYNNNLDSKSRFEMELRRREIEAQERSDAMMDKRMDKLYRMLVMKTMTSALGDDQSKGSSGLDPSLMMPFLASGQFKMVETVMPDGTKNISYVPNNQSGLGTGNAMTDMIMQKFVEKMMGDSNKEDSFERTFLLKMMDKSLNGNDLNQTLMNYKMMKDVFGSGGVAPKSEFEIKAELEAKKLAIKENYLNSVLQQKKELEDRKFNMQQSEATESKSMLKEVLSMGKELGSSVGGNVLNSILGALLGGNKQQEQAQQQMTAEQVGPYGYGDFQVDSVDPNMVRTEVMMDELNKNVSQTLSGQSTVFNSKLSRIEEEMRELKENRNKQAVEEQPILNDSDFDNAPDDKLVQAINIYNQRRKEFEDYGEKLLRAVSRRQQQVVSEQQPEQTESKEVESSHKLVIPTNVSGEHVGIELEDNGYDYTNEGLEDVKIEKEDDVEKIEEIETAEEIETVEEPHTDTTQDEIVDDVLDLSLVEDDEPLPPTLDEEPIEEEKKSKKSGRKGRSKKVVG